MFERGSTSFGPTRPLTAIENRFKQCAEPTDERVMLEPEGVLRQLANSASRSLPRELSDAESWAGAGGSPAGTVLYAGVCSGGGGAFGSKLRCGKRFVAYLSAARCALRAVVQPSHHQNEQGQNELQKKNISQAPIAKRRPRFAQRLCPPSSTRVVYIFGVIFYYVKQGQNT